MNGKKNNMQTAHAKLPRGFADRSAAEIAATEKMLAVIKESYELYGFEAVETPLIEFTEALGEPRSAGIDSDQLRIRRNTLAHCGGQRCERGFRVRKRLDLCGGLRGLDQGSSAG